MMLLAIVAISCSRSFEQSLSRGYDQQKADELWDKLRYLTPAELTEEDVAEYLAQANYALDEGEKWAKAEAQRREKELGTPGSSDSEPSEEYIADLVRLWTCVSDDKDKVETIKNFVILSNEANKNLTTPGPDGKVILYTYDEFVEKCFSDYSKEFRSNFKKFYDRAVKYGFI